MNSTYHNEMTIHFSDIGAGDPIVLLHAGGSSGKQWRKVNEFLLDRFRLIAPDLIGFGETAEWAGEGELTHDIQADAVAQIIDKSCDGSAHLVGHSYGGATAVRLCRSRPERIASLVLIEPIVTVLLPQAGEQELFEDYRSFAQNFIDLATSGNITVAWKSFIDLRNGTGSWDKLDDRAQTRFLKLTSATVDGFKSNLNNPTTLEDCRSISVPTLIVCGEKTTLPEKRVTEILHSEIPDSHYEIISDAEHMSPLTHPSEVAKRIAKFINQNSIRK